MVCWYEGEDLRSENKTIYGHPLEAYMELDGVTPLDVDEDGITDLDEMDPVNSTTMSIEDFVEIYGDNQTMMDSQFNPFIRESTPPIVLNIKITKHERWGDCVTLGIHLPCLMRLWAEIEVEALDVSEFSVTVTISEDDLRSVTFVGKGHEWFMVALDLKRVEVLVRYKVSIAMEDFAGNRLDPPYEKEMDGLFGGVLRMLEDLWDWLVDVATAVAEAVARAVNFIVDWILGMVEKGITDLLDPLLKMAESGTKSLVTILGESYLEYCDSGQITQSSIDDISGIVFGPVYMAFLGFAMAITILGYIFLPFTATFGFIIAVITALIISVVMAFLMAGNESDKEPGQPDTSGSISMIQSSIDIADPPERPTTWDWLRVLLPFVTAIVSIATASNVVAASIGVSLALWLMFGLIILDSLDRFNWGDDYLAAAYSFLRVTAVLSAALSAIGAIFAFSTGNNILGVLSVIGLAFATWGFWDSWRNLNALGES